MPGRRGSPDGIEDPVYRGALLGEVVRELRGCSTAALERIVAALRLRGSRAVALGLGPDGEDREGRLLQIGRRG